MAPTHWLWLMVFVLSAFYFYFRPSLNLRQFFSSFLILLAFSLSMIYLLNLNQWLMPVGIFLGFLFFLLMGVKNLIFANRQPFYTLFNALLFLSVFLFFFGTNNIQGFLVKYLITFLVVFLLVRDFLSLSLSDSLGINKKNLMAFGLAFLILQFLWVIALLPIGFINAAPLALLTALILEDLAVHHLKGTISRRIVLRNATVFLILSLIIFGASKLTILS